MIEIVLRDLRRVIGYAKERQNEFVKVVTEHGDKAAQKALEQNKKELAKSTARAKELDTIFRKLYEDNALGKLSDNQFTKLTSGYDEEQQTLEGKINSLQREIDFASQKKNDVKQFLKIVDKYTDIQELTYENLHEFIERIEIHEWDKERDTRGIDIYYNFVGIIAGGQKRFRNEGNDKKHKNIQI